MSNALIPVDQIQTMAAAVAKSGLFGVKTMEQAMALMLVAQAEGMHPAIAARDYHVIQGRPALKADAMMARFQQAGGKVEWTTYTNDAVVAKFSHPQGGSVVIEWTIAMAKAANLTGKDVWKQYPRAMLRARVISEGIRTVYPGVAVGVYTPEEIQDFDAKPTKPGKEKDMGAASRVDTETGEIADTEETLAMLITMSIDEAAVQALADRCNTFPEAEARKRLVSAGKKRIKAIREAAAPKHPGPSDDDEPPNLLSDEAPL